jgi:hypothetical protein
MGTFVSDAIAGGRRRIEARDLSLAGADFAAIDRPPTAQDNMTGWSVFDAPPFLGVLRKLTDQSVMTTTICRLFQVFE